MTAEPDSWIYEFNKQKSFQAAPAGGKCYLSEKLQDLYLKILIQIWSWQNDDDAQQIHMDVSLP